LKRNGIQIGGKCIENLLLNVVLEFSLKIYKFKKTPFHASSLENGLEIFQFGIIQSMRMTYGT
jgi:hypothetical protein